MRKPLRSGEDVVISITLNTDITNETMDDVVQDLMYAGSLITTGAGDDKEVLSDGDTITWEFVAGTDITISDDAEGATTTITGIMADASALGDGEDVTAVVSCQRRDD